MIRALILCLLVAGVGGAESQKRTFTATATLPSPLDQRIVELEKRVVELERINSAASFRISDKDLRAHNERMAQDPCMSIPSGCSDPKINPHPFGTEPEK